MTRERMMGTVTALGAAVVAGTEMLGAFHALTRTPAVLFWLVAASAIGLDAARRWRPLRFRFNPDPVVVLCTLGIGLILTLTAITALFSPPNSADAMAYHLPRIVYWAEEAGVRPFPTPYLNQIML